MDTRDPRFAWHFTLCSLAAIGFGFWAAGMLLSSIVDPWFYLGLGYVALVFEMLFQHRKGQVFLLVCSGVFVVLLRLDYTIWHLPVLWTACLWVMFWVINLCYGAGWFFGDSRMLRPVDDDEVRVYEDLCSENHPASARGASDRGGSVET